MSVQTERRLRPPWSSTQSDQIQASLRAPLVNKNTRFLHAENEDSDQTELILKLADRCGLV